MQFGCHIESGFSRSFSRELDPAFVEKSVRRAKDKYAQLIETYGITPGLVRISCGIEPDLVEKVRKVLEKLFSKGVRGVMA